MTLTKGNLTEIENLLEKQGERYGKKLTEFKSEFFERCFAED